MFSFRRNKKKKEVREQSKGSEGGYDKYIKRVIYLYVTHNEADLIDEIKNSDDMMLKAHSSLILYGLTYTSDKEFSNKHLYELHCHEIGLSESESEEIFKTLDKNGDRVNEESAYVAEWFGRFTSGDSTLIRDDLMWKKYGSQY